MTKTLKSMLALVAGALAFSSCSSSDDFDAYNNPTDVTISHIQTATAGTFDPEAVTTTSDVAAKSVCSLLQIETKHPHSKLIAVVEKGSISGEYTVTPSTGATTVTKSIQHITILPPFKSGSTTEREATIPAGTYFIAMTPGTVTGLTIDGHTDTDCIGKTTDTETLKVNSVLDWGDTDDEEWAPKTSGKAPIHISSATGRADSGSSNDSSNDVIDWIQLWDGGPKFAKRDVGATGSSDIESTFGTELSFADATKTGSDYVWGENWKTPSKDEMDLLNTAKVTCTFCTFTDGVYGFKFTGVQDGYTSSSLFLPSGGSSSGGSTYYWSSTPDLDYAWILGLDYDDEDGYSSSWFTDDESKGMYVRPVLK